ncbi:hypothetical protein EUA98_14075 [Pengzhenrongella frigida]|uniref:Uncharacterized protein n=1 Tax=Pengzhenrongella frigida TaxID=1259133 RepID=A0A4Q5MXH6_9MICO|nr:hypothetical protein EUA98_14075 [Cellulomonas sp. HLT2-17]
MTKVARRGVARRAVGRGLLEADRPRNPPPEGAGPRTTKSGCGAVLRRGTRRLLWPEDDTASAVALAL